MDTSILSVKHLSRSVMAVPPLARRTDYSVNEDANLQIIRHLEAGGVSLLLYGGNANFYHLPLSEYEQTLEMLASLAADTTLVIPSAGPTLGLLMEQAKIIRRFAFSTVMVLPQQGITTSLGVAKGVRAFVEAAGIPAMLYIKQDGFIEPEDAAILDREGLLSAIKYATVRPDSANDPYLRRLVDLIDPNKIISGIGEQPAIEHLRDFALGGFTSGCVCIAPRLSQALLSSIRLGLWEDAQRIQNIFKPLENIRNSINPIRVLHQAVESAGIAVTGPLLPMLSNVDPVDISEIATAAKTLFDLDQCASVIR